MPALAPSSLLSVAELATHLHASGFSAKDQPAAERAVAHAVAEVTLRLGFDITEPEVNGTPVDPVDLMAAAGVAVKVAAQWFINPQDRQSYSGPDGLSYTGSPQVVGQVITAADRAKLQALTVKYAVGF